MVQRPPLHDAEWTSTDLRLHRTDKDAGAAGEQGCLGLAYGVSDVRNTRCKNAATQHHSARYRSEHNVCMIAGISPGISLAR